MKVDSNKLGTNIHWVCLTCGKRALGRPNNKGKKQLSVSTYHNGICDVCRKEKAVTETRDFGYPIFIV